ncbi:MAG: MBL fold metallo-hydrolase RNA specificity domain-containing protein [Acidobacteriota bacterium]
MQIEFLGACRQVTGSSFLFQVNGLKILIDCGLYQEREYLSRNWADFPVPPEEIDFILLTHIHLDHCGLLPKVVRNGFKGKILTTSASQDLLPVMLLDSARIQEEDAVYKKKRHQKEGRKGPHPEIPLYTVSDAENVFPLVKSISYNEKISLNSSVSTVFHDAGHILGAAIVEIKWKNERSEKSIIFSGDIGQWDKPIVQDPSVFKKADFIVMEATYGDRLHEDLEAVDILLAKLVNQLVEAGGKLVIPTFAVERAQEILYHLSRLNRLGKIPTLPVFLDSPMAVDVTEIFQQHKALMDEETRHLFEIGEPPFRFPGLKLIRSVEESKTINDIKEPCIIMAGSGMCTGGRIKHHLVHTISSPENIILFVGYQAKGTLGRQILEEKPEVRILGKRHSVKARIEQIQGFSAHADKNGLLSWLDNLESEPEAIFLVHGDEEVLENFASETRTKNLKTLIPSYLEKYEKS